MASFHSGDPDQVVPVVLYTVHSHSSRRLQQVHAALSLSISPDSETILYFAVYGPAATILLFFFSVFAQISLRNLQTTQFCWREAGVITVLYFLHSSSYTTVPFRSYTAVPFVPFNCADSAVQVYRSWAILVPAFSL